MEYWWGNGNILYHIHLTFLIRISIFRKKSSLQTYTRHYYTIYKAHITLVNRGTLFQITKVYLWFNLSIKQKSVCVWKPIKVLPQKTQIKCLKTRLSATEFIIFIVKYEVWKFLIKWCFSSKTRHRFHKFKMKLYLWCRIRRCTAIT